MHIQKRVGTKADGILGPKTADAILKALSNISEDSTVVDEPKATEKIKIALLPGHSSKAF